MQVVNLQTTLVLISCAIGATGCSAAAVAEDWSAVVAHAKRILRGRPFHRNAVALPQGAAEALDQDAAAVLGRRCRHSQCH